MASPTETDLATRAIKKGWVTREPKEAAQDAREEAAERTRRSVKSERKPGPASMVLAGIGHAPEIAAHVVKDTVERGVKDYRRRKSPLYKNSDDDSEED